MSLTIICLFFFLALSTEVLGLLWFLVSHYHPYSNSCETNQLTLLASLWLWGTRSQCLDYLTGCPISNLTFQTWFWFLEHSYPSCVSIMCISKFFYIFLRLSILYFSLSFNNSLQLWFLASDSLSNRRIYHTLKPHVSFSHDFVVSGIFLPTSLYLPPHFYLLKRTIFFKRPPRSFPLDVTSPSLVKTCIIFVSFWTCWFYSVLFHANLYTCLF